MSRLRHLTRLCLHLAENCFRKLFAKELCMVDTNSQMHFDGSQLILSSKGKRESYDARLLISTLLVYVAKSDGNISEVSAFKSTPVISPGL